MTINDLFSKPKLWLPLTIIISLILFLLTIFTLIFISCRRKRNKKKKWSYTHSNVVTVSSTDRTLLPQNEGVTETSIDIPEKEVMYKDHMTRDSGHISEYTMEVIEVATNGFASKNMIGNGDFGEVFYGILMDNTPIVVKKLFSNRCRKTRFVEESDQLLLINHKNLVKLLGYCAEETYRMLVYEYVDNGSLDQWLHGCVNEVSPLTWKVRMNIIVGVAKGLAYLHEDIAFPLIHGNLKSGNILLDKDWTPKISNFGTRRLLGPEWEHVEIPSRMLGYIAPECEHTFSPDKKSDIYSFGILIMEIVTGKTSMIPSCSSCEIKEYLVDWVKLMVAQENYDVIVDPKLPERPTTKELKRILLLALRCVDFEVEKRPIMGEVLHMLEPRDLLLTHIYECFLKL